MFLERLIWIEEKSEILFGYVYYVALENENRNEKTTFNHLHAVTWALWLDRNNCIFYEVEGDISDVWERVKYRVALWVSFLICQGDRT